MQQSGQRPGRAKVWRTLDVPYAAEPGSRPATKVRGSSTTNIDCVGERRFVTLQIPEFQIDQPSMMLARVAVRSAAQLSERSFLY